MNPARLVLRSLAHHRRNHLAVFAGAATACAILVGALTVGDSVRFTLRSIALSRLGDIHLSLHSRGRMFRQELAVEMAGPLGSPPAPGLLLPAAAVGFHAGETSGRAGKVQVLGAGVPLMALLAPGLAWPPADRGAAIGRRLAERLGAGVGDEVLLRIEKPSLLSRDAPLSTLEDASVAVRLPVARVLSDDEGGRFGLQANQIPALTAFVPLPLLQEEMDLEGRANLLAAGPGPTVNAANQALWQAWTLADASLELRVLKPAAALSDGHVKTARPIAGRVTELRTDRVFLDPPVAEAALKAVPGAQGVLTYFVNELRAGARATPYSSVAALEAAPVPSGMRDDEIVLNDWTAADLGVRPGQEVTIRYYVVGPLRRLEERSAAFRVRAVVPIRGAAADRDLMPAFPGVADSENCRDWQPGIPIETARIRDKDEEYWDLYRGTPKAFVTLAAGQKLWNNRFGNLTAVRYPSAPESGPSVEACIRQALNPASLGMFFQPVREQALAAGSNALDFGQLFLGFSFFLIFSALLLTAMLFGLSVEQRSVEAGTLLAVGFPPVRVRRQFLAEGAALALLATGPGALLGVAYTRWVVYSLSTVWKGAVAGSALLFHAEPVTMAGGAAGAFAVSLAAIWLVTRQQARAPARRLLAGGGPAPVLPERGGRLPRGAPTALVCLLIGLGLTAAGLTGDHQQAAGIFFGAGSALLIAALSGCRALLARWEVQRERRAGPFLTSRSLGVRGATRRSGRSMTVMALLASGSFMVLAVGASQHDPGAGAEARTSGSGGFAFYAESSLPVHQDLNDASGLDEFGLAPEDLPGARVVSLRLREGDEASCLNLNRAQVPRLLGVSPEELRSRGAFAFAAVSEGRSDDPWSCLQARGADGEIPAVGDENTVVWGLGLGLGKTLEYPVEDGRTIRLRITGILRNSILQGSLLVSEESFTTLFPSESGYRVFLVDAPPESAAEVGKALGEALADIGFDAIPTAQRLSQFAEVENTYLSIFGILGGLGLLLGSVGLGIVVLRHALERRSELALFRALGFRAGQVRLLLFHEHAFLLVLGLLAGILPALVAVAPSLSGHADVPWRSLGLTLAAVFAGGFLWTWLATTAALQGKLLAALRSE